MAARRHLEFSRSAPWFGAFFAVALVAFWPSYLSLGFSASSELTHLHAATASLWMLLLVAQPLAIAGRNLPLHRAIGRVSYLLAPLVVASVLLLAHDRIRLAPADFFPIQAYILYLQLSLAVLFALSWGLGIATRRRTALHARFMVCTALTLVDPVLVRFMLWVQPQPSWNYQWLTFAVTDLLFVALIVAERRAGRGNAVFPAMLAVFVAAQLPALLQLTQSHAWMAFARWLAAPGA